MLRCFFMTCNLTCTKRRISFNIPASYMKHSSSLTKSGVGTNYFCDRTIFVSVQVLKILQKLGDIKVFYSARWYCIQLSNKSITLLNI